MGDSDGGSAPSKKKQTMSYLWSFLLTLLYTLFILVAMDTADWIEVTIDGEKMAWSPYSAIASESEHHSFLAKAFFLLSVTLIVVGMSRIANASVKHAYFADGWCVATQFILAVLLFHLFFFAGTHVRFGSNLRAKVDVQEATNLGAIFFYIGAGLACIEPLVSFTMSSKDLVVGPSGRTGSRRSRTRA